MNVRRRALVVGIGAVAGFLFGSTQGGPIIAVVLAGIGGAMGLGATGFLEERARSRRVEESKDGRG